MGIAEQHALPSRLVSFEGIKPVCAIYSTFLQRAYDQVIHDVCIQNLPVVFAMDRGGVVGDDGRTHQGAFDISYLRPIPNIVLMAPKDENELQHMLYTAVQHDGPSGFRFPRGNGFGVEMDAEFHTIPIGKAERDPQGARLSYSDMATPSTPPPGATAGGGPPEERPGRQFHQTTAPKDMMRSCYNLAEISPAA